MSWSTPTTPSTNSSRSASTPSPRHCSDGEQPRPDDIETNGAAWFSTAEIADLKVHPAMRLRIDDALRAPRHSYFE